VIDMMNVCLQEVREVLRMLRRPFLLEQSRLARSLRQAYGATDALSAVLEAIREATSSSAAYGDVYSEIIHRCDVKAESTKQAAAAMHMSIRTFFRFRKDAIALVAVTFGRRLRATNTHQVAV